MVRFVIVCFPGEKMKLVGIHYVAEDHFVGIELLLFSARTPFFIRSLLHLVFLLQMLITFMLGKRTDEEKFFFLMNLMKMGRVMSRAKFIDK